MTRDQLPEGACTKAGWPSTAEHRHATAVIPTSESWIASLGSLGLPPVLGVLYVATAGLINKIFAWCPPPKRRKRQPGADRTSKRLVCTIAEA